MSSSAPFRIAIIGPGNIGGYLGIAMGGGGVEVWMLYREGRVEGASADRIVDRRGAEHRRESNVVLTDDPRCLDDVDLCLVCVKAHQTPGAQALLEARRGPRWIVSLQNGLESADDLRSRFGDRVLAGVVTFNVTRSAAGTRLRANRGAVIVEERPEARRDLDRLAAVLEHGGVSLETSPDIEGVRAGKLLLNLNNGVSAATGLSVNGLFADRDARWCVAECLREGDQVLRACGYRPARVGLLSALGIAHVMALPGVVLTLASRLSGMTSDRARPSTLQDLERGHPTEIAALNGAIVRMAEGVGRRAPANQAVTRVVRAHESHVAAGTPIIYLSPGELRDRIEGERGPPRQKNSRSS